MEIPVLLTRTNKNVVFLSSTQATQQLRERIEKWAYVKLQSFCTIKEVVSNIRDLPQNGRKSLLAIHQSRD
jgi:hypothetical protein